MKKAIVIMLSVLIIFSASIAEEYQPQLGLSMNDFIIKYNAIGSALGSPLVALKTQKQWTVFNDYNVAWFAPDSKKPIILVMMSKDPAGKTLNAGLDRIQITMTSPSDFLSFLTVSDRCAQLFAQDILSVSTSQFCLYGTMEYYYESNSEGTDQYAYWQINQDPVRFCRFFMDNGQYVFDICADLDY